MALFLQTQQIHLHFLMHYVCGCGRGAMMDELSGHGRQQASCTPVQVSTSVTAPARVTTIIIRTMYLLRQILLHRLVCHLTRHPQLVQQASLHDSHLGVTQGLVQLRPLQKTADRIDLDVAGQQFRQLGVAAERAEAHPAPPARHALSHGHLPLPVPQLQPRRLAAALLATLPGRAKHPGHVPVGPRLIVARRLEDVARLGGRHFPELARHPERRHGQRGGAVGRFVEEGGALRAV
mmetsp:Transcript_1394/g.3259  ORF Transcript_1394/g.3259 Transcript_1394/m.3259 type:complete len:236 (-) Transcript_1394:216-923(-)